MQEKTPEMLYSYSGDIYYRENHFYGVLSKLHRSLTNLIESQDKLLVILLWTSWFEPRT